MDFYIKLLTSRDFLIAALAAIAVASVVFTLGGQFIVRSDMKDRIKRVALEREKLRAEEMARLGENPALATTGSGPRGWQPLHYVCHSTAHGGAPERLAGLAAIARRLLSLGADPNLRFPWRHHGVQRPVLWGAAVFARALPLAQVLLEAGASPNDGVTLPLAAAAGDLPVLELLRTHGVDVNSAWATDGSAALYAILHWAKNADGVRWLLQHGAQPDPVFAPNGETPLHVIARQWDAASAELFVRYGADPARRRADGRTPYAVAELNGNRVVADWLRAQGAPTELSAIDRFVATCSRGDRAAAEVMLAEHPALRAEIGPEHYVALRRAAERNDLAALETMLACGFDPNVPDDDIGATALHRAAMEGWPEATRTLLAHGAAVAACDREFHAPPLIWAAEGARSGRPYPFETNRLPRIT